MLTWAIAAAAPVAVILCVFVALIVFGVIYGSKKAKERQQALQALADQLDWGFDPHADRAHDERYGHFGLFSRGHSRAAFNTLRGTVQVGGVLCQALMGDYRYTTTSGSGKNRRSTTRYFSYLLVHLPFSCPPLVIRRETFSDKVAGAFGFDDIDFESEEFSRAYHVQSDDKSFAYAVCHARMMEHLIANPPPLIDIERGRVCWSDGGSRWSPEEFAAALQATVQFMDLWPEHVVRDLMKTPPGL